jgi:hypothetical protein
MTPATEMAHHERPTLWVARLLAILLALGGCYWGLLLSPMVFRRDVSPLALAIFGPGYFVTLGYIIRSVSTPPKGFRLLIWLSSLLVQGAWLLGLIWDVIEKMAAGGSVGVANIAMAWWVFATVASMAGLIFDMADPADHGAEAK